MTEKRFEMTETEIHKQIDKLTLKQQVLDLQWLLKHHADLKALGMSDSLVVELLSKGLLQFTVKEILQADEH